MRKQCYKVTMNSKNYSQLLLHHILALKQLTTEKEQLYKTISKKKLCI